MTASPTRPAPIRPARRRARRHAAVAAAATLTLLAACSSTSAPEPADAPTAQADALTVTDPWVKAVDEGMTAAFGTVVNTSDADVRIVSATSDVSPVELHEMVVDDSGAMVMQEKDGGFVVPAGGSHELAPGGDHLMLMDVAEPVEPGADVTLTLTAEDGSTLEVTAPARSFSGAEEEYAGGTDDGTGDMDMGTDAGDEGDE